MEMQRLNSRLLLNIDLPTAKSTANPFALD